MAQSASRTVANIGSPESPRRLAYAAARQRLRDGLLDGVSGSAAVARVAREIAEETGCYDYDAVRAVSTMIGGDLRDDAPPMPELAVAVSAAAPVRWTSEREAAYRERLRPHVWPAVSGLPAVQSAPVAPAPIQPQSFERPKRRIVLG